MSKTKFFSGVEDEDEDVASAPSSKSSPDEFVGFFLNSFFGHDDGSFCVQRSTDRRPTAEEGEIPRKVFDDSDWKIS